MKNDIQPESWQKEESRIFLRDIFFMFATVLLSVGISEQFLLSKKSTPVDRVFSYVIVFIPLGILNLVAHYYYRNRRIRLTGNLRSSLRYRISLAFMIVSVLPSIPIFFISSNMIEELVIGFFHVDTVIAMNSAKMVIENYENKEKADFLGMLYRELPEISKKKAPATQSIRRLFSKRLLLEERSYAGLFLSGRKIFEINKAFDDSVFDGLFFVEGAELSNQEKNIGGKYFVFYRFALSDDNGYLLIANQTHTGMESYIQNFRNIYPQYQEKASWRDKISDRLRLILVMIYVFMIGFSLVIAWWMARKISMPIVSIAQATRDITDGKLDTKLKVQAPGELGTLIESFNQMTSELRTLRRRLLHSQRVAAWQEVARRLAHEIKNPLTPIQLSAERMLRRIKNPAKGNVIDIVENSATTIVEQVNVLKDLVKEFAEFARMPSARLSMNSLNSIISETVNLYREFDDVKIEAKLSSEVPQLLLDKNIIIGMVNNLIQNGIDSIHSGHADGGSSDSRIEITTGLLRVANRKYVQLKVEDSGPGIDENLRDKIFEPYFSTKGEHGSGLGLTLVERAILEHDARISVGKSSLGGAEFQILFRLDDQQEKNR